MGAAIRDHGDGADPSQPDGEVRASAALAGALDEATHNSLYPALIGTSVLYWVLAPAYLLILSESIRVLLAVSASVTALLLTGMYLSLLRGRLPVRWAQAAAAAVGLLILFNSLLHMGLVAEAQQTTYVLLIIVGVGFLILSRLWYAAIIATAVVGWGVTISVIPSTQDDYIHYGFTLLLAVTLSGVINIGRARSVIHSASLRSAAESRAEEAERVTNQLRTILDSSDEKAAVPIENVPLENEALVAAVQKLYSKERQRANQFQAIQKIATGASSILEIDELMQHVVQNIYETFRYHMVAIYLVDAHGDGMRLGASAGDADASAPQDGRLIGSIAGQPENMRDVIVIDDLDSNPSTEVCRDEDGESDKARSCLIAAVRVAETVFGVLHIQSVRPHAFDDTDCATAQTLADQLAIAIENARLFSQTKQLGVVEERNRLAREIHDSLAQDLGAIVWQLNALEMQLKSGEPIDDGDVLVASIRDMARESLKEARRSIWDLSAGAMEGRPFLEALQSEIDRVAEESALDVKFKIEGEEQSLETSGKGAMLRICQEAFTNIAKHSAASKVHVTLTYRPDEVSLVIEDNGRGFDTSASARAHSASGYGLISMRERARLAGGELQIASRPRYGTTVTITVPVKTEQGREAAASD